MTTPNRAPRKRKKLKTKPDWCMKVKGRKEGAEHPFNHPKTGNQKKLKTKHVHFQRVPIFGLSLVRLPQPWLTFGSHMLRSRGPRGELRTACRRLGSGVWGLELLGLDHFAEKEVHAHPLRNSGSEVYWRFSKGVLENVRNCAAQESDHILMALGAQC